MRDQKIHVTVDVVILTIQEHQLKVLLVKRGIPPFEDQFALPGGFVHQEESLEAAAMRELQEETGTADVYLEQLYTFGDPGRDPRGRVVTVAYYALIRPTESPLTAGTDAKEARWFAVAELPTLAFDHQVIVDIAVTRLRNKLEYTTIGFELLPPAFTLTELQTIYETILGKKLDKRNFRRRIENQGLLRQLKQWRSTGRKPARLYSFRSKLNRSA